MSEYEFGDLAKTQLTDGQIHHTPTYYPQYEILRVVRITDKALEVGDRVVVVVVFLRRDY